MSENPNAFPACNEANVNGTMGMTLRDWFATHAPEPHWRFMQDIKPKHYSPETGQPWSDADCNAAYEAEAAWELDRDISWRLHWADAMLAAREKGK